MGTNTIKTALCCADSVCKIGESQLEFYLKFTLTWSLTSMYKLHIGGICQWGSCEWSCDALFIDVDMVT